MARVEALRDAVDKKETGVFSSFAQHFSKLPNEVPNCLPAKCFFTLSLGGCGKKTNIRLDFPNFSNFSIGGNLLKILFCYSGHASCVTTLKTAVCVKDYILCP